MDVVKLIHGALCDEDIHRSLGRRGKMPKHGALSQYSTLDDLLLDLLEYAVVLYEKQETAAIGSAS